MKTINEILQLINSEIDKTAWTKEPRGLYEPIAYTLRLGGKRIRPAVALMACNLFSEDVQPAIKPAIGIEIFHNFTLLHDDIMDKADLRRGQPTVHKKWDENTAILSGDMMQIAAYQFIAETKAEYLKQVLDIFSQTAGEVCEGQQYDMEFEKRETVSVAEYLDMIRLKTAVLLAASLKTGAVLGGAKAEDAQALYDFGIDIGMAFQLKDDLLDTYGDEKTFGKKIGGDILCNKKTYLLTTALEKADAVQREKLQSCLQIPSGREEEKITFVTSVYDELNVKVACEDAMNSYYSSAMANLDNVQVDNDKKQELRILAKKLMFRED
ncbi:MAG: polyprenyl synthetase family protein [Prevotellaceae bacterium]|jgi:geranylgeranyl diphosphate synthase type II|nr:polyprenyl synthetase family protein [Prevotellaceae bacterium]